MPDNEVPQRLKRVVIKEELVRLTGHWRAALILNQFLYWLQRHRQFDLFLDEERARNPELQVPYTYGWIYKSAKELQDELMVDVSEVTLRRDIKLLVERGWLNERHNPDQRWDRELQYRPDIRAIQRELQALGYALEGYPLLVEAVPAPMKNASFTMKNGRNMVKDRSNLAKDQSLNGEGSIQLGEATIPETTAEITPETTAEITPDDDVIARLECAGLTREQAVGVAQRNHRLTQDEAESWQRWKRNANTGRNPDAVFAALIRKQRLPPGTLTAPPRAAAPAPSPLMVELPHGDGPPLRIAAETVWEAVRTRLIAQVAPPDYDAWLKPAKLEGIIDGTAYVGVPNIFVREELQERYLDALQTALQTVLGVPIDLQLVIVTPAPA